MAVHPKYGSWGFFFHVLLSSISAIHSLESVLLHQAVRHISRIHTVYPFTSKFSFILVQVVRCQCSPHMYVYVCALMLYCCSACTCMCMHNTTLEPTQLSMFIGGVWPGGVGILFEYIQSLSHPCLHTVLASVPIAFLINTQPWVDRGHREWLLGVT